MTTTPQIEVYANFPSGTVTSGGTTAPSPGATETWTVNVATAFAIASAVPVPNTVFRVVDIALGLGAELILVTACPGGTGSQSWTVTRGAEGTTPIAHSPNFQVSQDVTAGSLSGLQSLKPWQFAPEGFGAKGDGRLISDGYLGSASAVLTSGGLLAPAAPALATAASGGSILAGTYSAQITYTNPYGESLPSSGSAIATAGTASTITITAPNQLGDATGWWAYVTQAGGNTFTRQGTVPSYIGAVGGNLTLTAPPTSTGPNPPVANTSQSAPFTAADVGKNVVVWQPGSSFNSWLNGTITGFTDSAHVTMSATPGLTTGPTGVAYGTDDTAAIQAAINAANAYSLQGAGHLGEVMFGSKIYCVAGPAQIGGTNMANAQLVLPFADSYGGNSVNLRLTGAGMQELAWVWQETPPQAGTILLSMRFDATIDGTYGYPFVVGGANGPPNDQSNTTLTVSNLTIMVAGNRIGTPTPYGGLGLQGILACFINSFTYIPLAIEGADIASPNPSWPVINGFLSSNIPLTNIGLAVPVKGNKAELQIGTYTCEWAQWGLVGGEHMVVTNLFTYYCAFGWAPGSGGHGMSCLKWTCQRTPYALDELNFQSSTQVPIDVAMLNMESWTAIANDPLARLRGTVNFQSSDTSPTLYSNQVLTTGGRLPNLKLVSYDNNPAVIGPPSFNGSGTAVANFYYRDANVILKNGDGAVSAVAVDNTATGVTLSGSASASIFVPSGHSITPTYTFSSTAPTWVWILS